MGADCAIWNPRIVRFPYRTSQIVGAVSIPHVPQLWIRFPRRATPQMMDVVCAKCPNAKFRSSERYREYLHGNIVGRIMIGYGGLVRYLYGRGLCDMETAPTWGDGYAAWIPHNGYDFRVKCPLRANVNQRNGIGLRVECAVWKPRIVRYGNRGLCDMETAPTWGDGYAVWIPHLWIRFPRQMSVTRECQSTEWYWFAC